MLMIGDWGLVLLANALVTGTVPYCTAGSRVATRHCKLNSMATSLPTATTALTDSLEQVY